ncbi:helix-turn-helix transcriptional regulator [Flavobacterium sp. j3]|uniref:Helix-turn-helix transcriptional regulator n=1 Tax=Flavobacterium aureirubrum TaxID=3133147 RepID=A0ABU9N5P9_9FLAO
MNMLNKNIGKRVREIRKSKDISIEKMAENLKVSYSTYQRIELGETNSWVSYLDTISSILEVEIEDIVVGKENIEQNNNHQKGGVAVTQNLGTINNLSEKLIEQYEIRLKEKDETITLLNNQINNLNNKK